MHKQNKYIIFLPISVCIIQENTKKRHKLSYARKKYLSIQMKRMFYPSGKKKNYFGSIPSVFLRSGVGEEIVESWIDFRGVIVEYNEVLALFTCFSTSC